MTPRQILKSMQPKGELSEEAFQILLQEGEGLELLDAALLLKPDDPRGRLLIRRYKEGEK
jgi:hypothetical protein